ncbi:hypothetical protein H7Y29_02805, partial [Microbacteriaceae bacterium]|nr:hypothetical protein [Candidatus Saccharibacteria bacterium]
TGKTDFSAKTKYVVKDLLGAVKFQTEKESVILPGTTRLIEHDWERPTWVGVYTMHTEATVLGKLSVKDSIVIMAPKWLIFIALLALLVIVARAYSRNKTSTSKKSRNS